MSFRNFARTATAGVTVLGAVSGLVLAAAGSASAAPPAGLVCITNQNTIVRRSPELSSGNHLYTLAAGRGYRLNGLEHFQDGILWWGGHGNDLPDGWAPRGNLNC
jgi:hypothetical protein